MEAGLLQESDIKQIEQEVIAEVDEAVKFADESPKPVSTQLSYGCSEAATARQLSSFAALMVHCKPMFALHFAVSADDCTLKASWPDV